MVQFRVTHPRVPNENTDNLCVALNYIYIYLYMWAKHGRNVTPQRIGQENARRHSHVFFCSEPTAWPFNDATPNWIITVHIICMYKLYMCYDEKQRRYTYINISKICAYIYIYHLSIYIYVYTVHIRKVSNHQTLERYIPPPMPLY